MSQEFLFRCEVKPEWIDYNGHMQDAYYGLIFSFAVDALQDAVGFDAAYRKASGCTIYLLEDHKFFLREVHEGQQILVTSRVLDVDETKFHLHCEMTESSQLVAVSELMELHVNQHPKPHAIPMPKQSQSALEAAQLSKEQIGQIARNRRARGIGIRR